MSNPPCVPSVAMPGMLRSALNRSLRTGSESSGGELSPVNHLAEWRERLERSYQEDDDGKRKGHKRESGVSRNHVKPKCILLCGGIHMGRSQPLS